MSELRTEHHSQDKVRVTQLVVNCRHVDYLQKTLKQTAENTILMNIPRIDQKKNLGVKILNFSSPYPHPHPKVSPRDTHQASCQDRIGRASQRQWKGQN